MKRCLGCLLAVLICLLQSSCWDSVELDELGAIIGSAVDREGKEWVVSFQVVNPQSIATQMGGSAQSRAPVTIFSTRGKTLQEAVQHISLESSRKPFFAHNRVLILSEKVVRGDDFAELIDYYLRDSEIRETMDLVLTKGKAKTILEVLNPQEKIPANAIDRIFSETQDELSYARRVRLIDFVSKLLTPPSYAFIPELKIAGQAATQKNLDALKQTSQKGVMKIGDIGIFRGARLVGWLKREDGVGLNWVTDRIKKTVVTIPCSGSGDQGKMSSFIIQRGSTELIPVVKGEDINMSVRIKAEGYINETGCTADLSKPETIAQLNKQLDQQIQKDVLRTWNAVKRMKADVFGFGEAIHRKNPKDWDKLRAGWEERFPGIQLSLQIETSIRRTGMTNKPFSKILQKAKGGGSE
jgi:spore germination protein KC